MYTVYFQLSMKFYIKFIQQCLLTKQNIWFLVTYFISICKICQYTRFSEYFIYQTPLNHLTYFNAIIRTLLHNEKQICIMIYFIIINYVENKHFEVLLQCSIAFPSEMYESQKNIVITVKLVLWIWESDYYKHISEIQVLHTISAAAANQLIYSYLEYYSEYFWSIN